MTRQAPRLSVTTRDAADRAFFADGWNLFDVVVVTLSLVALGPVNLPINVLRSPHSPALPDPLGTPLEGRRKLKMDI